MTGTSLEKPLCVLRRDTHRRVHRFLPSCATFLSVLMFESVFTKSAQCQGLTHVAPQDLLCDRLIRAMGRCIAF